MTEQNSPDSSDAIPAITSLNPHRPRLIARRLGRDFEAFLAPGERFDVLVESNTQAGYHYAKLSLFNADKSYRLDLEGVLMDQDNEASSARQPQGVEALDALLDLLRMTLYDYFRHDRSLTAVDPTWRALELEGVQFRLRSSVRSPELEEQANRLLSIMNPDRSQMN